jgi:hypothetical protein
VRPPIRPTLVLYGQSELDPPFPCVSQLRFCSYRGPIPEEIEVSENSMGNSVIIHVEGVSITIVDGNIAIEQTKSQAAAAPRPATAAAKREAVPAQTSEGPAQLAEDAPPPPEENAAQENSGSAVIDGAYPPDQPNGSNQTKPVWSDEEIQKLRALYPSHSASAIGKELGRSSNSVKSKAQNLGLRKDGPPTVTAKPTPRPRSLSAAVTEDMTPSRVLQQADFSAITLLDLKCGQCRWIVSDVWPVMYCGAPVLDASSWCEQHSKRVFNSRPQGLAGIPRRFQLKAWP